MSRALVRSRICASSTYRAALASFREHSTTSSASPRRRLRCATGAAGLAQASARGWITQAATPAANPVVLYFRRSVDLERGAVRRDRSVLGIHDTFLPLCLHTFGRHRRPHYDPVPGRCRRAVTNPA
jgi:hypothetical protein